MSTMTAAERRETDHQIKHVHGIVEDQKILDGSRPHHDPSVKATKMLDQKVRPAILVGSFFLIQPETDRIAAAVGNRRAQKE